MAETNDYIIKFNGSLDTETIDGLINQFKKEQDALGIKVLIFKKIISVIIEALENIYKYSKLFNENAPAGTDLKPQFSIALEDGKFVITAGNTVLNSDLPHIKSKLEKITQLDHDGLKDLYIDTIRNGHFSNQGGAGLGFIKIARVAENNLEYSFEKLDDNSSYFSYRAVISD